MNARQVTGLIVMQVALAVVTILWLWRRYQLGARLRACLDWLCGDLDDWDDDPSGMPRAACAGTGGAVHPPHPGQQHTTDLPRPRLPVSGIGAGKGPGQPPSWSRAQAAGKPGSNTTTTAHGPGRHRAGQPPWPPATPPPVIQATMVADTILLLDGGYTTRDIAAETGIQPYWRDYYDQWTRRQQQRLAITAGRP